ncbi:hypothetical protein D1007_18706 [Hordeum vulgare]|nr:hypothetical protein D1007_18706 [Hordeum vulgare]
MCEMKHRSTIPPASTCSKTMPPGGRAIKRHHRPIQEDPDLGFPPEHPEPDDANSNAVAPPDERRRRHSLQDVAGQNTPTSNRRHLHHRLSSPRATPSGRNTPPRCRRRLDQGDLRFSPELLGGVEGRGSSPKPPTRGTTPKGVAFTVAAAPAKGLPRNPSNHRICRASTQEQREAIWGRIRWNMYMHSV